ncbi:DNA polymerase family B, partial [Dictyocaulus viviparus]
TPRPYWRSNAERDLLRRIEKLSMRMGNGDHHMNPSPTLDETLASQCFSIGEEDSFDTTTPSIVDFKEYDESVVAKETCDNELHEEIDENGDILAEEVLMTQIMDTLGSDEKKKEITSSAIEDFLRDDELTPQNNDSSVSQSTWVTLDIDLPLLLREATEIPRSSFPSDITGAFENASFQPMPMTVKLDSTAILSSSSNGDESKMEIGLSEISGLSAASLELLVFTQTSVPDPQVDALIGFSFCCMLDVCRVSSPTHHVFVTSLPIQYLSAESICCLHDERSLFEELENLIKKYDPDILFGYDTSRLSWGYVLKRAVAIGLIDFHHRISRYPRDINSSYLDDLGHNAFLDGHYDLPEAVIPPSGRLLKAVWKIVRSELQLSSTIVEYVNNLSLLNFSLLNEMNWFLKTAEMARVYGIQFYEVWSRGSQLRVESMMFRLAHKQRYFLPSVTPLQRTKMQAPEQLQLVMEPKSGVYFDPVIVLDFQSLYPSMVIAYNYCFSTVFGKVSELERMYQENVNVIEMGALKYAVPKSCLVECSMGNKLHCSPLSAVFVSHAQRNGVLSSLLRERLRRILNARQLALKLVANVTYGYTSANFSGRMPCVEVADAILGKGRETLERAISRVNEGNYGGAKVIYGDTDSMFVLVPGASKSEAFSIGRRIAADVTSDNPVPVVLKLEKVYVGCVLETKKRYAGWMYENENDNVGQLDAKGIETIRRDTCEVVAKVLERSLKLIFTKNWRELSVYLNTKLSRLKELPYTDFVFCKEFRSEYSHKAHVPQLKVALSLASDNPSHITLIGERVPYIVTEGPPKATVISCVRSLQEFLADSNLQVHCCLDPDVRHLEVIRGVHHVSLMSPHFDLQLAYLHLWNGLARSKTTRAVMRHKLYSQTSDFSSR